VIGLLKEADIGVVACPQTNLIMGGRNDEAAPRRGLAPVKELLAAGVSTSYGQDNMQDMFSPFGCGDTLQNGLITSLAAHMSGSGEVAQVFQMTTDLAARVLHLRDYGLHPGDRADFVVLETQTLAECIRTSPPRHWVVRHGRVIAGEAATAERDARLRG
jgi:cytosine deaminase